jgi:signal transduction histidine kinase
MQRQEAFVADASHQLRNPLTALVLRLDGLEMGLDEARRDQLRFAREEANRLADILDELIDLATAVDVTARPVLIDVTSLVHSRLAAWQPLAQHRRVRLTQAPGRVDGGAPEAGNPTVSGPVDRPGMWSLVDPLLLSSALDAVLDNAVKFTPSGGAVTVHVAGDGAGVRVDVVDNGPGLSENDLTHIGDRFWRSTASQNIAGSGLGLSIARALLGITGAQLEFAAAAPHGLRATLRLPCADGGGL